MTIRVTDELLRKVNSWPNNGQRMPRDGVQIAKALAAEVQRLRKLVPGEASAEWEAGWKARDEMLRERFERLSEEAMQGLQHELFEEP